MNGESVAVSLGVFSTGVALEEGEAMIVVTATDKAGNVARLTRTVRVDRTPPVLEILEPVLPGIELEVSRSQRWQRMCLTFRHPSFAELLPESLRRGPRRVRRSGRRGCARVDRRCIRQSGKRTFPRRSDAGCRLIGLGRRC